MTTANVHEFVEELKRCNEGKKDDIRVGRGIDVVVYTGGNPRELNVPYPFTWVEEEHAFSDLPTLKVLGMPLIYHAFYVRCEEKT